MSNTESPARLMVCETSRTDNPQRNIIARFEQNESDDDYYDDDDNGDRIGGGGGLKIRENCKLVRARAKSACENLQTIFFFLSFLFSTPSPSEMPILVHSYTFYGIVLSSGNPNIHVIGIDNFPHSLCMSNPFFFLNFIEFVVYKCMRLAARVYTQKHSDSWIYI